MEGAMRAALFALVILGSGSMAMADPMRPLAGTNLSTNTSTLSATSATSQSEGSSQVAERLTNTELRAIRRNASGVWEALLGTHWVHAGDRLKDARIVEVRSVDVVVLSSDGHRDVLSILPRLLPLETPAGKATKAKP
jgi:hypothetical protein